MALTARYIPLRSTVAAANGKAQVIDSTLYESAAYLIGQGTAAPTAWMHLKAPTTSYATLRLPASAAVDVAAPNEGDLWFNGTNLYFRSGGANIDMLGGGDVVGPAVAVDDNFCSFDLTTGKLIQDSGYSAASFQAADAGLASIAGLTTAADKMIYTTASDVYAVASLTAFARTILDDADQGTVQATLALVPGTNVQAYDATLTSLALLGTGADVMAYATGVDTWAETPLTSFARTILDDANAAAVLATIGAPALVGSSTDHGVVRFDGTSGAQQNSGVLIDDADGVTIPGNLTVNGTTTFVNTSSFETTDTLLYFAKGNVADTIDCGWFAAYQPVATPLFRGGFFDAGDGKFKIFNGLEEEPTSTVNVAGTGYTASTLVVGSIEVDNITIDGNTISSTDTNGNIILAPNGAGRITLNGEIAGSAFIDDDTMATASATTLASSESIKAYADSVVITDHDGLSNNGGNGSHAAIDLKIAMLTRETAVAGGKIELLEGTDNGTNKVALQSPAALTSNRTIAVPDADVTLADIATNSAARHTRAHTLTSASDHSGGNDKIIYTGNAGAVTELALGAKDAPLLSGGTTSAPVFGATLIAPAVITAAGATPIDSDVSTWSNATIGIVVGTGGRVFFAFKNASDVYYVEATAI